MPGEKLEELITPCAILDLDAAEGNLARAVDWLRVKGKALRPHFKVHRSIDLAQWQLERGARGITCARLDEAEALLQAGIDDILVANTFAGRPKCRKAAEIAAAGGRVIYALDNKATAAMLSEEAVTAGRICRYVIDIDLGMDRAGTASPEAALELYSRLAELPNLEFAGLMGYEGHLVAKTEGPAKAAAIREALQPLSAAVHLFQDNGIAVPLVSSGGTGSYRATAEVPEVTELQMGTFIFMDDHFGNIGVDFAKAAGVLARVTYRHGDRVVLDCGMKGMHPLHMPSVSGDPHLNVERLNAEHAICTARPGAKDYAVGDMVRLNLSYADGTLNLYSHILGIRNGRVERVFSCIDRL